MVVDMFIFGMWKIRYVMHVMGCNNSIWLLICLNFVYVARKYVVN
jgi:hypothetical protein